MTAAQRTPGNDPSEFAGNTAARKANDCDLNETVTAFSRFYGTKTTPAQQTPSNAVALAIADYRSHQFPVWEFVTQLRAAEDQLRAHDALLADVAKLRAALMALLLEVGNIEVLGEWSALDMNYSLQRSTRTRIDGVVADARAALQSTAGGATLPPPYPFCRTPDKCAGKGYCPRDPACND